MKIWSMLTALWMLTRSCLSLQGSCAAAGKCCDGKDTDCSVQKGDSNSIVIDLSDEPCYCDHGCLDMGDCCSDFKEFCGVLDCEVSDWSSWSPCSSSCGAGTSNRHRTVTRQEINGGVSCPDLHQAKACREDGGCARQKGGHSKHDSAALRESAMLLPGKYSQLGTDKYDVRQNLKTFKEEDNDDQ